MQDFPVDRVGGADGVVGGDEAEVADVGHVAVVGTLDQTLDLGNPRLHREHVIELGIAGTRGVHPSSDVGVADVRIGMPDDVANLGRARLRVPRPRTSNATPHPI
ncbi:hypothetical protein [Myceligenerans pegani]|uniref:Uncharacterized protein n=1 Tax=Myceligenerans pegani TaxID=2776917 RepID=A0ABR9MX64_9MICO|nr:hypothetical protein [Myceligenerans sp. TRM 65318]MBE1875984.1 hypothetical protein [Myceligenerans sp. TRM 65318]MBE3018255.1 hypothetical protein [Myceligenerans sp. TRM 65318]